MNIRKGTTSSMLATSLQTLYLGQQTWRKKESIYLLCWFNIRINHKTKKGKCSTSSFNLVLSANKQKHQHSNGSRWCCSSGK